MKISRTLAIRLYLFLSTACVGLSEGTIGTIHGAEQSRPKLVYRVVQQNSQPPVKSEPIDSVTPVIQNCSPLESGEVINSPLRDPYATLRKLVTDFQLERIPQPTLYPKLDHPSPQTESPCPSFTESAWFTETPENVIAASYTNPDARETLLHRLYKGLLMDCFIESIDLEKLFNLTKDMDVSKFSDKELFAILKLYPGQQYPIGIPGYLKQRVVKGDPVAHYLLAYCFDIGKVVRCDPEAAHLYLLAAKMGVAEAQRSLADMYCSKRIDKEINFEKAVFFYRLAAEQGQAASQNNLGYLYLKGLGIQKNVHEAVRLFHLSSEQGYSYAQHNLGCLCEDGEGVEQSYEEAAKYYRLAASQGHALALEMLGDVYFDGKGVEKDNFEAAALYNLAIKHGNTEAIKKLDILFDSLNYEVKLKVRIYLAQQGNVAAQECLWQQVTESPKDEVSIREGKENLKFLIKNIIEIEKYFHWHVIDVFFNNEAIAKNPKWNIILEQITGEIDVIKQHIQDLLEKPATLISCLHVPLWERWRLDNIMMTNEFMFQDYEKIRYLSLGNNREIIKRLFNVYTKRRLFDTYISSDRLILETRLSNLFLKLRGFYDHKEYGDYYDHASDLAFNSSNFSEDYLRGIHNARDYLNALFLGSIGWKG